MESRAHPRHRVLQNIRQNLAAHRDQEPAPSLKAGLHTITVDQTIKAPFSAPGSDPNHALTLHSTQDFEVYGIQYALPSGAVHQTYPPQGHADHSGVLPHIVFSEAHLPWERGVTGFEGPPGPNLRNSVPWLALLVFTEDELTITQDELASIGKGGPMPKGITELTQSKLTMDVKMSMTQMLNVQHLPDFQSPVRENDPDTESARMIFLRGDLFQGLFCSYDANYQRILPTGATNQKPDLSRYKYMAHVRNINTSKMADTGIIDDQGVYSVVISHRAGPQNGPQRVIKTPEPSGPPVENTTHVVLPQSAIVHLVSLEGVEDYLTLNMTDPPNTRIGLVSLYSWSYTVLPPDSINFLDAMRKVGHQIPDTAALRAPDFALDRLLVAQSTDPEKAKNIRKRLYDRVRDGYSLVRYLPKTGEKTAAFSRGPLTPTLPKHPLSADWPSQSNFSTNLQIVDSHLGMTDLTYSTAWELGRTLAIADKGFAAALNRIRHAINIYAIPETKKTLAGDNFSSRADALASFKQTVALMNRIPSELASSGRTADPARRWQTPRPQYEDLPLTSVRRDPDARRLYVSNVRAASETVASSRASSSEPTAKVLPYNEINVPNSTDWSTILKWIVDKMYLYNIPAHYLITDPINLPIESIRFFYIDPNWIDALIDGALSTGNHLEQKDDAVRQALKYQLNQYFSHNIDDKDHPFLPQTPTYGFFLRSSVVQAFPNLEVHAPWPDAADPRSETLRLDLLGQDVLICLLDRLPGSQDLSEIIISQPPHQQRYVMGKNFGRNSNTDFPGENEVEFEFRRVYTTTDPPAVDRWIALDTRTWTERRGETKGTPLAKPNPSRIFDFDTNVIVLPGFAEACTNILTQEMGSNFTDTGTSSALVGIQLADSISTLNITVPSDQSGMRRPDIVYDKDGKPISRPAPRFIPLPPLPSAPSLTASSATGRSVRAVHSATPYETTETTIPAGDSPTAVVESSLSRHTPIKAEKRHTVPIEPPPHNTRKVLPISADTLRRRTGAVHSSGVVFASASIPGRFGGLVFPLGTAGSSNTIVPVTSTTGGGSIPIDIIFSFLPNQNSMKNLQIHKVVISIPLGTGEEHLAESYDVIFGAGARMLSNQRFNPHLERYSGPDVAKPGKNVDLLVVTLVPRSTSQLVPLEKNPDISFVLNQVQVNGLEGDVTVEVRESYMENTPRGLEDRATGSSQVMIRKRKIS